MAQNWPKSVRYQYASAVSYLDLLSLEKPPDWLLGKDLRVLDLGARLEGLLGQDLRMVDLEVRFEGLLCLYPNVKEPGAPQETFPALYLDMNSNML